VLGDEDGGGVTDAEVVATPTARTLVVGAPTSTGSFGEPFITADE